MTEHRLTTIGIARTPFEHRRDAPCQPGIQTGANGSIEVASEFAQCLHDLEGFDRVWVLYIFDRNQGWRPKVRPPRDTKKRGLFATRGPHRPTPIGMVAARLVRVEGLTLHLGDLDLLNGTPVVDIKPYLRFVDSFPNASAGWVDTLDKTPNKNFPVGHQKAEAERRTSKMHEPEKSQPQNPEEIES